MVGYFVLTEERRRWSIGRRTVLGLPMLEIAVPGRQGMLGRFAARRAAAAAARQGVRRAVWPEEFPYAAEFARRGLAPVDPLPLYRALAPEIVLRRMAWRGVEPSAATVAVAAGRMTRELEDLITELALRIRYVSLMIPRGGEALCQRLRREYGVAVIEAAGRAQLEKADALLLLDRLEGFQPENPVWLPLWNGVAAREGCGVDLELPPEMAAEAPCEKIQLMTLLFQGKILQKHQISILEVDRTDKNYYNAVTME